MATNVGTIQANIRANTRDLQNDSRRAQGIFKNMSTGISQNMKKISGSIAAIGLTLGGLKLGKEIIMLGSDAEETQGKFDTAFKGIRKEAEKTAKALSKAYNMSSTEAKKLLSDTGDLLKGFGFTSDEALSLSNKVQQLSGDLASYNNLQGGSKRASDILTKALLGERDALVSLGVKISEADVKAELMKIGQDKLTGTALMNARAWATYNLVLEQTKDAQGDVARTSGSFANQMRKLRANLSDLGTTVGKIVLPTLTKLVTTINNIFNRDPSTSGIRNAFATILEISADVLRGIGKLVDIFSPIFTAMEKNIKLFSKLIVQILRGDITGAIETFVTMLKNTLPAIVESFALLNIELAKVLDNFEPLFRDFGRSILGWIGFNDIDTSVILTEFEVFISKLQEIMDDNTVFTLNSVKFAFGSDTFDFKEMIDSFLKFFSDTNALFQDWVLSYEANMSKAIKTIAKPLVDGFIGLGKDIVDGLIKGMKDKISDVKGAMDWLGGALISRFKMRLDIHSPSRVMKKQGEYVTEGLAIGITSKISDVADSMDRLANKIRQDGNAIVEKASTLRGQANLMGKPGDTTVSSGKAVGDWSDREYRDTYAENKKYAEGREASKQRVFDKTDNAQSNISKVTEGLASTIPVIGAFSGGLASGIVAVLTSSTTWKESMEKMSKPIMEIVEVIGYALKPVLDLVVDAMRGLAKIVTWIYNEVFVGLANGIISIVNGIIKMVNWAIPGKKWDIAQVKYLKRTYDLTDATEKQTKAINDVTASLFNLSKAVNMDILRARTLGGLSNSNMASNVNINLTTDQGTFTVPLSINPKTGTVTKADVGFQEFAYNQRMKNKGFYGG